VGHLVPQHAHEAGGGPLEPRHGHPDRAVVPGGHPARRARRVVERFRRLQDDGDREARREAQLLLVVLPGLVEHLHDRESERLIGGAVEADAEARARGRVGDGVERERVELLREARRGCRGRRALVLLACRGEVAGVGERVAEQLQRARVRGLEREGVGEGLAGAGRVTERHLGCGERLQRRHRLRLAEDGDARVQQGVLRLAGREPLAAQAHVRILEPRASPGRIHARHEVARHREDRVVAPEAHVGALDPGVVRLDHAPAREHDRVGAARAGGCAERRSG
jgi:hypothetical protein